MADSTTPIAATPTIILRSLRRSYPRLGQHADIGLAPAAWALSPMRSSHRSDQLATGDVVRWRYGGCPGSGGSGPLVGLADDTSRLGGPNGDFDNGREPPCNYQLISCCSRSRPDHFYTIYYARVQCCNGSGRVTNGVAHEEATMLVIGILIGLAGLSGIVVGRRLIIGSILMIIGYALTRTAISEMHGSFMQDAAQVVPLALIILIVASIVSWYKRGSARTRGGAGSALGRLGGGYDFWSLTPAQFEQLVAQMLVQQGYTNVQVCGGAGDLGADVTAQLPDSGGLAVAQCKRYAPDHKVGSPEIQQFIGMVYTHHGAQQAIYVSTGGFTEPAIELAHQHGIELVDAARLQRLLQPRLGAA